MNCLLLFFTMVFFCVQSLWAISTETHTYILDDSKDRILVIDRKTGRESFIKCVSPISMFIQGNKGYVGRKDVDYWEVLDLRTHQWTTKIPGVSCKDKMLFHENKGYAYSHAVSLIDVLDLDRNVLVKTMDVGHVSSFTIHEGFGYVLLRFSPFVRKICLTGYKVIDTFPSPYISPGTTLKLYKDKGYLINARSQYLTVFDLDECMFQGEIPVGHSPVTMEIHGRYGYVLNKESGTTTVINLEDDVEFCTLSILSSPTSIVFYENKGYVLDEKASRLFIVDLNGVNRVAELDLRCFWKLDELAEPSVTAPMIIMGHFGIIQHTQRHFTIIQLDTFEFVDIIFLPRETHLFITDTHFYGGTKKLNPRPDYCFLFREPYVGIEGYHLEKDADEAYKNFEQEVARKDYKRAKEFFDIAISLGHPKSFAVAFFAFFNGKFGAEENMDWAKQFVPGMDLKCYESFCENHGFPVHCTCPTEGVLGSEKEQMLK